MSPAGPFAEIVRAVRSSASPQGMSTKVIAVDGPGGAGKSSFAARLAEDLGGAPVVHTDDFASWDNPTDWWPRLLEELLEPLSRNERGPGIRRSDWGEPDQSRGAKSSPASS